MTLDRLARRIVHAPTSLAAAAAVGAVAGTVFATGAVLLGVGTAMVYPTLLAAIGGALSAAMAVPADREAALITFLVTASGMSFLGLSAAFWGLIFGIAAHLLLGLRKRIPAVASPPAVGRKEQPAR